MVECDLAKVEVASSNLVSRSIRSRDEGGGMRDEKELSYFILYPSALIPILGGVAKW